MWESRREELIITFSVGSSTSSLQWVSQYSWHRICSDCNFGMLLIVLSCLVSSKFFSVIGLKFVKPWSFKMLHVTSGGVECCVWSRIIKKSLNMFATVWGSVTIVLLVFMCIGSVKAGVLFFS